MRNLILPNPTKYEVTYKDSKNNKSNRKLVVIDQTKDSITAYCYAKHGIRTFKKSRILAITSTQ